MQRIPVKDNITGTTIFMWDIDAEEAVRYEPTRFTPQSPTRPIPKKNPGGKGF